MLNAMKGFENLEVCVDSSNFTTWWKTLTHSQNISGVGSKIYGGGGMVLFTFSFLLVLSNEPLYASLYTFTCYTPNSCLYKIYKIVKPCC